MPAGAFEFVHQEQRGGRRSEPLGITGESCADRTSQRRQGRKANRRTGKPDAANQGNVASRHDVALGRIAAGVQICGSNGRSPHRPSQPATGGYRERPPLRSRRFQAPRPVSTSVTQGRARSSLTLAKDDAPDAEADDSATDRDQSCAQAYHLRSIHRSGQTRLQTLAFQRSGQPHLCTPLRSWPNTRTRRMRPRFCADPRRPCGPFPSGAQARASPSADRKREVLPGRGPPADG